MKTLSQQSSSVFFTTFFALVKAAFVALVVIAAVLIIGQSRVAPVSVNLLTAYATEYAVTTFKPYRHLFPKPYEIDLNHK